jgi:hypothetical protein
MRPAPPVLKPKIDQAVKSGTLALILAGDCSVALPTVANRRSAVTWSTEVGKVLRIFAKRDSLAAIEVTVYNPATDFDRLGAKTIIGLVADALHSCIASGPEIPQTESGSIGNADSSQNSDASLVSALETERVERPLRPSSLVNGADETSS